MPRGRGRQVPGGRGGFHGARGGVSWAGAPCPEPLPSSNLALFLPGRNNFLLPGPGAQELRGKVLGRSFAVWEPVPRRPSPAVAASLAPESGHPSERQEGRSCFICLLRGGARVAAGAWGGQPGSLCADPFPLSGHALSLGARWTWPSQDAHHRGPRKMRPPGPHPSVSLCPPPTPSRPWHSNQCHLTSHLAISVNQSKLARCHKNIYTFYAIGKFKSSSCA